MEQDQESSFKWFILITYSISWISIFSGVLYGKLNKSTTRDVFYIIGAIGPIIAFLSLMATYKNKEYNKTFWKRAYYPKMGPMWLILSTVLLPIVLNMLLVLFSLIDNSSAAFSFTTLVSKNGIFLLLGLTGILGWYGYAFPLLFNHLENPLEFKERGRVPEPVEHEERKRFTKLHKILDTIGETVLKIFNKLRKSIQILRLKIHKILGKSSWISTGFIIGILWSVWHFPIVFIFGTYPQSLGVDSFGFWEFFLLFPIQSLIVSWIYVKTKNSTFTVMIFFLADITRFFFALPLTFQVIRFVLWILIAGFIILNENVFHIIPISESE